MTTGVASCPRLVPISYCQANPIFEAYVTRTREEIGMAVIHDKDAVKRTPRALRDNHMVAFVSDHDALGLASTFVPFFGRPA